MHRAACNPNLGTHNLGRPPCVACNLFSLRLHAPNADSAQPAISCHFFAGMVQKTKVCALLGPDTHMRISVSPGRGFRGYREKSFWGTQPMISCHFCEKMARNDRLRARGLCCKDLAHARPPPSCDERPQATEAPLRAGCQVERFCSSRNLDHPMESEALTHLAIPPLP